MHVCKAEGGILALAGLLLHLVALLLALLLLLLYYMVLFLHLLAFGWSPQNKEHGQKPSLSVHEELPCVLSLFWHSMSLLKNMRKPILLVSGNGFTYNCSLSMASCDLVQF